MPTTHIVVLLGTARKKARSSGVAAWVVRELEKRDDCSVELFEAVNGVEYTATVPPWGEGGADEKSTPWMAAVSRADAILIVSPEYNHGYPGELKLLLDSLYAHYTKKPCGIISVSNGNIGGARMAEQLRLIVNELGMVPMKKAVHISGVDKTFDETGEPTETSYPKRLSGLVDDIVAFAILMGKRE